MSVKITESVTWVGKVDWELRKFHGEEYSTHRGSSYNSYLIKDKKIVLIDTVWEPFADEFVNNLAEEVPLENIDFIVANHGEIDHSGALPKLMEYIPDKPIYCTANAVKSLRGQYHKDWNFKVVKTGDTVNIGSKNLIFIEAPMLHWPDSMFTYMDGENILFSNDAFGQHYATELLYNDLVDQSELFQEAIKYYANILTPFSKLVVRKIEEFKSLNLPLDMICTSHGVVWRKNPMQIVEKYLQWANDYHENQITIIYDTMWGGTRKMAEAIARGISEEDKSVVVKLFNIARSDVNDVITEVFKSKAILIGSATINRGVLGAIAGFMELVKGLGFKNKKASQFGTYGWSGESTKVLKAYLEASGFEVVHEGILKLWSPEGKDLADCKEFGREFAAKVK